MAEVAPSPPIYLGAPGTFANSVGGDAFSVSLSGTLTATSDAYLDRQVTLFSDFSIADISFIERTSLYFSFWLKYGYSFAFPYGGGRVTQGPIVIDNDQASPYPSDEPFPNMAFPKLNPTDWQLLAFIFNGETVETYVDGALVGTGNRTFSQISNCVLGTTMNSQKFKGNIGDFAIWDTLSTDNIEWLSNPVNNPLALLSSGSAAVALAAQWWRQQNA